MTLSLIGGLAVRGENEAPAMTLTTNTDAPAHENQQCGGIFKGQTCPR